MAAKQSGKDKSLSVHALEPQALALADAQGLELVELTMLKEPRGKVLCVYLDKVGGLSLDDCEAYHRAFAPMCEQVDYDFLEVSSPGLDRPVKTQRDFEKNRGNLVEVRLFTKLDGQKTFQGLLEQMDEQSVTILISGEPKSFPRQSVALIKPIIEFDEDEEE